MLQKELFAAIACANPVGSRDLSLIEYLQSFEHYLVSPCARYTVDRILQLETKRRLEPEERWLDLEINAAFYSAMLLSEPERLSLFRARARAPISLR